MPHSSNGSANSASNAGTEATCHEYLHWADAPHIKKDRLTAPLRNPIKDTGGDAPNNSRKPRAFLLRSHHQPCTHTPAPPPFSSRSLTMSESELTRSMSRNGMMVCCQGLALKPFSALLPSFCHARPCQLVLRIVSEPGHTLTVSSVYQKFLGGIYRHVSGPRRTSNLEPPIKFHQI